MNLSYYKTSSGKNVIIEYIDKLTIEEQVDAYSVLEKMENGEFESIKHKRWEKKIREVYFYKHNRIFYITVDGNDIYLLHACKKQKNKTEKKEYNASCPQCIFYNKGRTKYRPCNTLDNRSCSRNQSDHFV